MGRVFVSYRQESQVFSAAVRAFAARLRDAGVEVVLDQFYLETTPGGPPEGWAKWCADRAKHGKVLVAASAGWFACFEHTQPPGAGLGAAAEASIVRTRLYEGAGENADIRIALLSESGQPTIPAELRDYHRFRHPEDLEAILAWVRGETRIAAGGWPANPPDLAWEIADHGSVRDAVARLLTRDVPQRLLPIVGGSETGKTTVTREIRDAATSLPWLSCGRLDFKGTADVSLRSFAQELGVSEPKPGSVVAGLTSLLGELRSRERPTLLVFDTFEQAGEAVTWLEDSLCFALSRAWWLRVVVAGQRPPEPRRSCAEPVALAVPGPEHWHALVGADPHLDLTTLTKVHLSCSGSPKTMAMVCRRGR